MQLRHLPPFAATVLVAIASLGAEPARADGAYIGGSLGTPHYPDGINGISGGGTGASGKLYGGYALTPRFALEAGAADLGRSREVSGLRLGL